MGIYGNGSPFHRVKIHVGAFFCKSLHMISVGELLKRSIYLQTRKDCDSAGRRQDKLQRRMGVGVLIARVLLSGELLFVLGWESSTGAGKVELIFGAPHLRG